MIAVDPMHGDLDWRADDALENDQLRADKRKLERECARLRIALRDARRSLALAPDVELSGSAWWLTFGRVTVEQIFTKMLPRVAVYSAGAGIVTWVIVHWVR